jgi:hypothetical protein
VEALQAGVTQQAHRLSTQLLLSLSKHREVSPELLQEQEKMGALVDRCMMWLLVHFN